MGPALPYAAAHVRGSTAVLGVFWLVACATLLVSEMTHPGITSTLLCAAAILTPAIVRSVPRLGVYLLGTYAAVIPLSGLVGGSGLTLMKLLGIGAATGLILSAFVRRRLNAPSKPQMALLLLLLYAGATIFWAIDSDQAFTAYTVLLTYAALFIVTSIYPFTLADSKFVVGATVFGGIIAAFCGVYLFWHGQQFTSGVNLQISRLYIGYAADRSIDPNEFSAMLLVPITVMLAAVFAPSRVGLRKVVYLAALCVLLLAFALSASRGSAIGLAIAFGFLLWRSKHRIALTLSGAAAVTALANSPLFQRFTASDMNSADGRFDIWKVGAASLQRYWLAGAGIGNFNEAFRQYYLAAPHLYLSWDRVAHSVLLQSAVEYGVIGFALVISLWYLAFRELAHVPQGSVASDLCVGLRAGILGLFVAGFSLDLMSDKYVWLALSLVTVMRAGLREARVPVDRSANEPPARARAVQMATTRDALPSA